MKPTYANAMAMLMKRNHFTVERWGIGYAITVHRQGHMPETILADTLGEANRLRMQYSAEGLIGLNVGAL